MRLFWMRMINNKNRICFKQENQTFEIKTRALSNITDLSQAGLNGRILTNFNAEAVKQGHHVCSL